MNKNYIELNFLKINVDQMMVIEIDDIHSIWYGLYTIYHMHINIMLQFNEILYDHAFEYFKVKRQGYPRFQIFE